MWWLFLIPWFRHVVNTFRSQHRTCLYPGSLAQWSAIFLQEVKMKESMVVIAISLMVQRPLAVYFKCPNYTLQLIKDITNMAITFPWAQGRTMQKHWNTLVLKAASSKFCFTDPLHMTIRSPSLLVIRILSILCGVFVYSELFAEATKAVLSQQMACYK